MQNDNKKTKESVPTKSAPARAAVESRSVERLDAFVARIGAPSSPLQVDRRGRRKTIADVDVPQKQTNGNALRFGLRAFDVVAVTAIIMVAVWNAYVGQNDRGMLAPIAAGLLGAVMFIFMLFSMKAHRFAPAETYSAHMKKVAVAAGAALGLWLTTALMTRPDTFMPDALAKAGFAATAGLFLLHSLYYSRIKVLHRRGALTPNIVMLGATESARRLIETNAKTHDLNILAIFDDRISRAPLNIHGVPIIGKIEDMLNWDQLPYINRIVVTLPSMAAERKQKFIEQVRLVPNSIAFLVDEFENLNHVQQRLSEIANVSLRDVTGKAKSGRHTAIKRLTDKGEMSLVGPRPHAVGMRTEGKDSIDLVAEYAHRHRVKPGMTGWAQINGSRGALLNQADVARRVQLDIEYIERSSFFFDLMIMLKTLPCLLGDSETIR